MNIKKGLEAAPLAVVIVAMLSVAAPVEANFSDPPADDPNASYPLLQDLPGADISGEAGIIIYVSEGRALVEADGGLYDVGDRPLEVGFNGLAQVTLWFVLCDHVGDTTLFMTRDGSWTDTLGLRGAAFDYVIRPGGASVYSFEIADPGQNAPTVPDIVLTPIEDAPEPQ